MIDLINGNEDFTVEDLVLENLTYSYFFYELYYEWYFLKNSLRRYYFYSYMPKVWKNAYRYRLSKLYLVNTNYWYLSKKKIILKINKLDNIVNLSYNNHNKVNSLTKWF